MKTYIFKDALPLLKEIHRCIDNGDFMPNDWENDFLDNIEARRRDLSEKQSRCLEKIYEKATTVR